LLIQAKTKSTIFSSNLPKKVARIGGPPEDVTKIWADHGGPKGSNGSMEVNHVIIFWKSFQDWRKFNSSWYG
jgi:hypothetical protein